MIQRFNLDRFIICLFGQIAKFFQISCYRSHFLPFEVAESGMEMIIGLQFKLNGILVSKTEELGEIVVEIKALDYSVLFTDF
jgi:hypothetical protein